MSRKAKIPTFAAIALATLLPMQAIGHGDVAPQPMNTDALPEIGEEWLTENPYRADKVGEETWRKAIQIGDSGYNQNCARCHGLGAVSGGLAPDLRFLEAEEVGDEWFAERFISGYTQDGTTKMPAFGDVLGQKAAWAIRTYIETRPEDGALDNHTARLTEIRNELAAGKGDIEKLKAELLELNKGVATASGAPVADSVAARASVALKDKASEKHAAEILTVGLSAAE